MKYQVISVKADTFSKWIAIALGFSIPLSTALDNILIGLLVLCWVLGAGYHEKWRLIRSNPVAWLALALFALFTAGLLYGDRNPGDGLRYLGKYKELLLIPLLIPLFQDANTRRKALASFAAAMVLTLVLSYLLHLGLSPETKIFHARPGDPVVFKEHITQSWLIALAAFLFAAAARYETVCWKRVLMGIVTLLAICNVLFMLKGRTGYLVLAVLFIYLAFDWLRWKGLIAGITACIVLGTAVFYGSTTFQERVLKASKEISEWQPHQAASIDNSIGLRLEWYKNSLEIIGDHPVLGVGMGGFPKAYAEKIKGSGMLETRNPHNEYLLIAVQTGLVGLALLLYLFYRQWRLAAALPTALERNLAHGLILAIMFGCLFNSLLVDHTESLLYGWMSGLLYAGLKSNSQKSGTPT